MSENQAVLLYAFVALAIVSKLAGGIEQIAYAQMWDFAPDIQKQSANNVHFNKNKVSIISSCIHRTTNIQNTTAISSGPAPGFGLSSSTTSSSQKCGTQHFDNTQHFPTCRKLAISPHHPGPRLLVPPANTTKYNNVIKAISPPPPMNVQEICGTNHDDYIIGSEGDDIIFGLRGNDIITALGGDDLVFAGPGDDIVYGGAGNNQLFGQEGNDNLIGGTSDDLLVAGAGNDRLYGNAGDDILQGGPGADYFDCGDGLDTVVDYTPTQGDVISINCENVNLIH
jgi:RTX calcium-binding nonapeptide repeat (4 copies)